MAGQGIVWDLHTGTARQLLLGDDALVSDLAFTSDGRTLAAAGSDAIRLFEVATGRLRRLVALGQLALSVGLSPDGGCVATDTTSGEASLWDWAWLSE